MATVKVWNDNDYPYSEKFKGEMINIKPKSFVEMDFNEASHFLGTFPKIMETDAEGRIKPESYKRLRIENPNGKAPVIANQGFKCMQDGAVFQTQEQLDNYILAVHTDKMVDEDAKKALQKRGPKGPRKGVKDDSGDNRDGGKA
jgi:hypothetical protein